MLLVAPKGHPFKHTRYCWDTGGETCTCDAREEEDDGRATAASATTDNQILDFDQTDFLIDFDDDDSATLPTIDLEHPCATASPSIATNSSSSSCLSSPEVDLQSYIFGGISPAPTSAYPPPISPHDTTTFDTLCDFDFDINSLLSDNSPAVSQLSEEELYELYTHTATPTTSTTTSPSTVIVNQSSPLVVGCDSYTLFGGELGVAYHSTDTTFATTSNTNTLATQESSSKETTTMATATTTTATYNNHPFVGGISTFNRKDMDMFNNDFELYGHEHNTPRHQQSQQTSHHRGSHVVGRMLVSPAMSNMSDDFGSVVSGASASSITVGVNTSSSSPVTAFSRPMKRKATDTPSTNPLPTPPPSKPFRTPQTPAMSYTSTSTSTASAQTPLTRPASPTQILEEAAGDTVAVKRARNTLAARRYRQKRVERLEELEALLVEAERERERYKEEAMNWRMECEKWRGRYEGVVMGGGGSGNPGAGQK